MRTAEDDISSHLHDLQEAITFRHIEQVKKVYPKLGAAVTRQVSAANTVIDNLKRKLRGLGTLYVGSQLALENERDKLAELHGE